MSGFAKYLPAFGWKPYVLTIKEKYIEKLDNSNLEHLDDVQIFRTRKSPSLLEEFVKIMKVFKKKSTGDHKAPERVERLHFMSEYVPSLETPTQKLKRLVYSLLLSLPDYEKNWIIPACQRGLRLIKDKGLRYILTSSPPHSAHLVGLILKKLTHVRWIADFRDPWMTPFSKGLYYTSAFSNRIERFLEREVVRKADLVLCNTELLCEMFKTKFTGVSKRKFICLPNGFDDEVFSNLRSIEKYETFTLCYTGTIYLGRTPEPVFQALQELDKEKGLRLRDIRIKLVGNCRYLDARLTSEVVSSYGLDSVVEIIDHVPYSRSLEIIRKSHLALLLASDQPYQIPAKVYDYIGAGTRILALTEEGATANLINGTGSGMAIDPTDIQGIKGYIRRCIQNVNDLRKDEANAYIHFDRKAIIRRFVQLLESM